MTFQMKGKNIMTTQKKIVALTLTLIGMFQLTSCKNNDMHYEDEIYLKSNYQEDEISKYYTYYNPSPFFYEMDEAEETIEVPESSNLNEEETSKVNEIFAKLTKYYGIEKEMPEIRRVSKAVMNQGNTSAIDVTGKYDRVTGVIYVTRNFEEATVAHEMLHYLSGDGFRYNIEGNEFAVHFSEGVTNYLSTKLYPFPDGYSVYELETHQAQMLATAIGEDNLAKAYFFEDITSIRDDFNSTLQNFYANETIIGVGLTPFDIYVGCIDAYSMFMTFIDEDPETVIEYISLEADTIESMMLVYGIKKGKGEELKKLISKLLQNEDGISWSYYTSFSEMIS